MRIVFLILFVFLLSCSYRINFSKTGTCTMADTVTVTVMTKRELPDSLILRSGGQILHKSGFMPAIEFPVSRLCPGNSRVSFELILKNGRRKEYKERFFVVSDIKPRNHELKVIETLPHDTSVFVQGLTMHRGLLYESAGLKGRSRLRIIDPATGECVKDVKTDPDLFNEGIAFVKDTLYMITWKDSVILMFDEELHEISRKYFHSEGWGLFSHDDILYFSNGTNQIIRYDPANDLSSDTLLVVNEKGPLFFINETEWIDGSIWANVYGSDSIMVIDPFSGKVTDVIGEGKLLSRKKYPEAGILNGIAYDKEHRRVYLTGKNWPFIKVCNSYFDD